MERDKNEWGEEDKVGTAGWLHRWGKTPIVETIHSSS